MARTRSFAAVAVLPLLVAVAATGCGGAEAEHFDLTATRTCLETARLDVKPLADEERGERGLPAPSGGSLIVDFGQFSEGYDEPVERGMWLAFAASEEEAEIIAEDAELHWQGGLLHDVPGDVVEREGNVVLYVFGDPYDLPDDARSQVEECLRSRRASNAS